jgi:quercetin dioxygenase-like cupin family protein
MEIRNQLSTATLVMALMFCPTGCSHKKQQTMSVHANETIFPIGERITNGYFTGEAFLRPLLARDKNNDFVIGNVSFQAGARTNWHTHPKGQVLLITDGEGLYQEIEKPARQIKKGDVVSIPENIKHWHGASAHSSMTHIAITNYKGEENVVWLQPVSEQEYNSANK